MAMPKATSGGPAPCRPACQEGAPLTGMPAAPRWQPRRHVAIPGQAPASAWASGKGGVGAWRTRPLRRLAASAQRGCPLLPRSYTSARAWQAEPTTGHVTFPGPIRRQRAVATVLPVSTVAVCSSCVSFCLDRTSKSPGSVASSSDPNAPFLVECVRDAHAPRTCPTSTAAAAGHARSKDPASDIARRQGAGTRNHNQVRAPHTHRSAHGHSAQGHPSLTS